MMRPTPIAYAAVLLPLVWWSDILAQDISVGFHVPKPPVQPVRFDRSLATPDPLSSVVPPPNKLLNEPESALNWRATFYGEANGEYCTATLIGSRTILTAAHCIPVAPENRNIRIKFGHDEFVGHCERYGDHPDQKEKYDPGWENLCKGLACPTSFDVALCEIKDNPQSPFAATKFENIAPIKANPPLQELQLVGYGCTTSSASNGSTSTRQILFRGKTTILEWPDLSKGRNYFLTGWTKNPNNPLSYAGANICPGDSGGAVYNLSRSIEAIATAVVSRKDANNRVIEILGPSALTVVSRDPIRSFLVNYADRKKADICGINSHFDSRCLSTQ